MEDSILNSANFVVAIVLSVYGSICHCHRFHRWDCRIDARRGHESKGNGGESVVRLSRFGCSDEQGGGDGTYYNYEQL
jgi:hypothetical protein